MCSAVSVQDWCILGINKLQPINTSEPPEHAVTLIQEQLTDTLTQHPPSYSSAGVNPGFRSGALSAASVRSACAVRYVIGMSAFPQSTTGHSAYAREGGVCIALASSQFGNNQPVRMITSTQLQKLVRFFLLLCLEVQFNSVQFFFSSLLRNTSRNYDDPVPRQFWPFGPSYRHHAGCVDRS